MLHLYQVFPVAFLFIGMLNYIWGDNVGKLSTYLMKIIFGAVVVTNAAGKAVVYYF